MGANNVARCFGNLNLPLYSNFLFSFTVDHEKKLKHTKNVRLTGITAWKLRLKVPKRNVRYCRQWRNVIFKSLCCLLGVRQCCIHHYFVNLWIRARLYWHKQTNKSNAKCLFFMRNVCHHFCWNVHYKSDLHHWSITVLLQTCQFSHINQVWTS